jgi:hypothetical protein
MRSPRRLDRLDTAFDDGHLVADAGLLLSATLAQHLGLKALVNEHPDLGDRPGQPNRGDKLLTLVFSALAGGDSIDDRAYPVDSDMERAVASARAAPALPTQRRRLQPDVSGRGVVRRLPRRVPLA